MRHPLIVRAALGSALLVACVALLATMAQAADLQRQYATSSAYPSAAPQAPDLFGTVALPVHADRYSEDWERAQSDASALPQMQRLIAPAWRYNREQQLAYVQSAVHKLIHWESDATLWGLHDYWASAAETLEKGAGDMDNRAIVKMQALRALGFPTRDLYLTMGYDKVGGPITVLIVRLGGKTYLLDDTGGAPYTAEHRPEFEPMLSFGYGASWIHGHRITPVSTATRTASLRAIVRR
jgi:predicted transglutaminase-like cysteine proteinase